MPDWGASARRFIVRRSVQFNLADNMRLLHISGLTSDERLSWRSTRALCRGTYVAGMAAHGDCADGIRLRRRAVWIVPADGSARTRRWISAYLFARTRRGPPHPRSGRSPGLGTPV